MNLYCAVILNRTDKSIISTWACYADSIKEAEETFDEELGFIYERCIVYFRFVKES